MSESIAGTMRKAVITLTDDPKGDVDFDINFGGDIDRESTAHLTALWLLRQIQKADDIFALNHQEET